MFNLFYTYRKLLIFILQYTFDNYFHFIITLYVYLLWSWNNEPKDRTLESRDLNSPKTY